MNSTRSENVDLAMKMPKARSWRRTREAFEAVQAAFSPGPEGRHIKGDLLRQISLLWGPPRLRRFGLHLTFDMPI